MSTPRIAFLSLFVFVGATLFAGAALAADPQKVAFIVSVKVSSGDRAAYYAKLKQLQADSKRLGNPLPRVWRETLAGTATDTVHIVTEYASLEAYAAATAKTAADPESAKLLREIEASGLRTVLARGLMVDDTP